MRQIGSCGRRRSGRGCYDPDIGILSLDEARRHAACALAILAPALAACGQSPLPRSSVSPTLPPGDYTPREPPQELALPPADHARVRRDALRRARVWEQPPVPIAQAALDANPGGPRALGREATVECRFLLKGSDGRTPKFSCVRPGGDVLKVKYGHNNPEVYAEVAATRLLAALGFGADEVHLVARVRCFGCPAYPYPKGVVLDALRLDPSRVTEFTDVTIERRLPGLAVDDQGWGWGELDAIDPHAGGATPAERDALRLLAAFLGHWDGKPENQRLLCRPADAAGEPCARPLAYIHDPGQTFGPKAVDLDGWSRRPVWGDATACVLSMRGMPYEGASFGEPRVSEEGRRLAARLLRELRREQVRALFEGARFTSYFASTDDARQVENWVRAFEDRVAQIADRPPCPR